MGTTGADDVSAPEDVAAAGAPVESGDPQPLQKREPTGGTAPQATQTSGSFAPQPLQNADPAGGSCPQLVQITRVRSGNGWVGCASARMSSQEGSADGTS